MPNSITCPNCHMVFDERVGQPQPEPTPQPTPNPTPQPAPPPTGAYGSKENPIPLNKLMNIVDKGYMSPGSPDDSRGEVYLPFNTTLWFSVDPRATLGRRPEAFGINSKYYNAAFYSIKCTQNKTTGDYTQEIKSVFPSLREQVYNDINDAMSNTIYLYGLINDQASGAMIDVWVTIQ